MARYTKFDKNKEEPFPISRSGIDQFLRCPRTFILHRKFGLKPPSMAPLTLAVATDHLLKNEFDGYRKKQSSEHPISQEIQSLRLSHTSIPKLKIGETTSKVFATLMRQPILRYSVQ